MSLKSTLSIVFSQYVYFGKALLKCKLIVKKTLKREESEKQLVIASLEEHMPNNSWGETGFCVSYFQEEQLIQLLIDSLEEDTQR